MINIKLFSTAVTRTIVVVRGVCVFLAFFATASVWAGDGDWTVEKLMSRLAEVEEAKLDFLETKQSIFLITDIKIRGVLQYRAPHYIEKHTMSPFEERVVIDGDSMVIERKTKAGKVDGVTQTQRYSVQSHPLLKAAVDSIRDLLAGNIASLNKGYNLVLQGEENSWNLKLSPKSEEIQDYIDSLELTGSGIKIERVITIQSDGDESTMDLNYQFLK